MITEEQTEKLVHRIKNGDREAEDQFCKSYYDTTLTLTRKLVREPLLAEDLTQETIMTVLLNLRNGKVRQSELLSRYVNQTARYTVIAWYRRKANQTHPSIDELPIHDEGIRADEIVFNKERREIVAELLASMGVTRDREILSRHYLHDEDKKMICEEKDLSSQHFDRVISRARNRCRELVAQQGRNQIVSLMSST